MFKRISILTAAALFTLGSYSAQADFPERTIENIFPWSAGTAMSMSQIIAKAMGCLLYTSPSPRDLSTSRMPSSA